jgi:putative peptidoglycan lipid II flippase
LNVATAAAAKQTSNHRRVFRDAATVGILTSATKVAAAVKVVVTARYFGASDELDAFLIAFLLPGFFVDTVAGTFTPSLVPELIRARAVDEAGRVARSGLALVLAAMLPLTALLIVMGRWIVPLLGSSFSESKVDLTATLLLSMLIWLPLGACSATWRAVLNAHGRVALAAGVQMGTPIITMAFLFFGGARWGVWVLSAAVIMGCLTEFGVLAFAVHRLGYSLWPDWSGWRQETVAIRAQYFPLLAGTLIVAGCGLVDQAVAGSLGSGSVSALSYGVKYAAVLIAIGGTGMATAVLPEFSRLVSLERWTDLRRALRMHVGVAMLVMLPITTAFIWWSGDVVRFTFQRGEFGPEEAMVVTGIQRFSLLLVPFAVMLLIAQRLATALSATGLILRAGVAAMIVNIAGDLLLPRWLGVRGVALSSCIAYAVYLGGLLLLLNAKEPRLFRRASA